MTVRPVPPTASLEALTTLISSGSTPRGGAETYLREGPIMLVRSQNVQMNRLVLDDVAYISEEIDFAMKRSRVKCGDVLLNITGASIGRVATFNLCNEKANVNQHVCIIRPKPEVLDYRYLAHLICTPSFQSQIDRIQHGGTRQALTFSQIANFLVPLPPLQEQRRIAVILDKAEELRAKRRANSDKISQLSKSLFSETFGSLKINPKRLEVCTLRDICTRITDGTHQPPQWCESGIPFLFVSNIVDGEIDFQTQKFISKQTYKELMRRCPVEINDLLYTTVGSYGNAALVTSSRKFAFQRHIAHLKPDKTRINPEFLLLMLQSREVRHQADRLVRGVAQKTLNLNELNSLVVFKPSLSMQDAFVRRASAVQALRAQGRAALAQLDALFASLQHRAFRGEL